MTIMPSDLPVNVTGLADEFSDTIAEAFPLFGEVQKLARLGVRVGVVVAPSTIAVTIRCDRERAHVLPSILDALDEARPTVRGVRQYVTGRMAAGFITVRVEIPAGWVTDAELALLARTPGTDQGGQR